MDVAPKYAGIVMGVSNTVGTLAGIIGVDLTGRLLEATKVNKVDLLHKGWRPGTVLVHVNPRKLLKVDASLDYDYAGPNPKHDSRGRSGGSGGKNP